MFTDTELALATASKKDYRAALIAAGFLMLCAALNGSRPVWIITISIAVLLLSWLFHRQPGSRPDSTNKLLRLNSNGAMLLEDHAAGAIAGSLSGPQWCTRYLAILRYKAEGRVGHLLIFKVRQCPEQFRQLSVWLRHNSHNEGSLRT